MHTVKPLDANAINSAARETGAVFTLEEHSVDGGLGGAVAELLAEAGEGPFTFRRFGLPSAFSSVVGTQEYLRARHGLTAEAVASAIISILRERANVRRYQRRLDRLAGIDLFNRRKIICPTVCRSLILANITAA